MKIPKCSGCKRWTGCGYEYDCDAKHNQLCEDCLCNYDKFGGLWDPKTGKKIHPLIAFFKYGIDLRRNKK